LVFGELGDFIIYFIIEHFQQNIAKIWGFQSHKTCSALFFKLFITRYTYIAENLPHFGGILCIFGEFRGF
jgi:hypothetical protein